MNNYSNPFNPLYIISQIIVTVMESLRANQQISGVQTKYQIEIAELETRIRELETRIKLAQRDQDKLVAKQKSKIGQLQFNTNLKGSALLLVIAGIVILHIFGGNKQRQEQKLQNEQKQEQYTQLENDLKANQNQIADLKSQLDAAQKQKQQLESKLETAQQAAQKQAQDLESKLETAQQTAQKQLQDLKSELDNEQSQRAQLETELKTATNQSVIVNGSKDANTIELATSFGEYKASLNTLKDTLKERLAASDLNIENLKKRIDDIQNTSELLSNTKNQITELNDELIKTKKDVEEMKNRIIESLNQQNKIDQLQNKIKELEKTGETLDTKMKVLIEINKKASSKNTSKNTSNNTSNNNSKAIDNSNQTSIESTSRSKYNRETTLAPEACNLGQKDNTMRDNDDDTGGDSGGSSGSGNKRESVGSSKTISQTKEEEKKENNTGDSTSGNQQGQPVKTSLTIAIPIFIPQNSISIGTNYTNSLESVPLREPISLETNLGLKNPVPLSATKLPPLSVKNYIPLKTPVLEEKYVVIDDPNRIRVVNNQLIKGSNSDNAAIKSFNVNGKQSNGGDLIPVYRPENESLNNKPIVNGDNGLPLNNETGSNLNNVKLDNGEIKSIKNSSMSKCGKDDALTIIEVKVNDSKNYKELTNELELIKKNKIFNYKYIEDL